MQDELEGSGQRALDRGAAQLGIALGRVRIAHRLTDSAGMAAFAKPVPKANRKERTKEKGLLSIR